MTAVLTVALFAELHEVKEGGVVELRNYLHRRLLACFAVANVGVCRESGETTIELSVRRFELRKRTKDLPAG